MRKIAVIGFLGTTKDAGVNEGRWARWRPTISLCAQPDFVIDRLDLLLCKEQDLRLFEHVKADIQSISPKTDVRAHVINLADPWKLDDTYASLLDFARAYRFEENVDYHVHLTTGTHQAQICLYMLTESRFFPAKIVDTQLVRGAEEPWRGKVDLIDLDLGKYDLIAARHRSVSRTGEEVLKNGIPTRNAVFNATISKLEKVSMRSEEPMLITGPTGAGKSKLACGVFDMLKQRHLVKGVFVELNCATLTPETAQSTLFGHKKGAYTGATSDRQGLLMAADGGVLFLDEIGELSLDVQAQVLVAFETKSYLPMGSDKPVKSNFRLIAGTNKDLRNAVANGSFREDLLNRINLWSFRLPSLAQRREDIEPNLDYEIERVSNKLNRRISFNQEARARYLAFALSAPWPGNFRDLSASVMRMATLADGGRIVEADVDEEIGGLRDLWGGGRVTEAAQSTDLVSRVLPNKDIDLYDRARYEIMFSEIKNTPTMAEAGRRLFAASRTQRRGKDNDGQRVWRQLQLLGLNYKEVKAVVDAT